MQGATLTGYKVEYSSGLSSYQEVLCAFSHPTNTKCEVQASTVRVQLGEKVSFRVIATSNVGDSLPSLPAEKVFSKPPTAPINLRSDKLVTSESRIALKFDPPRDDRGSAITGYRVYWKQGSDKVACGGSEVVTVLFDEYQIQKQDFNELSLTIDSLEGENGGPVVAGQQYYFQVQAKNAMGYGDLSSAQDVIAASAPGALASPSLTQVDECGVKINWFKLDEDQISTKTSGYKVTLENTTSGRRLQTSQQQSSVTHEVPCLFSKLSDNNCLVPMEKLQDFAAEGQDLNLKVAALSNVGESLPSSQMQLSLDFPPSRPLSIRNDVL